MTVATDLSEFISAGFYVTRAVDRRADMSAALLPATLVSLSGCISAFVPDTWCIAWTTDSQAARLESAARFGLNAQALQELTEWATARFDTSVRWPNVLSNRDAAQELVRQFFGSLPGVKVLELGLHRTLVGKVCEAAEPPPQEPGFAPVGRQGIHELLLARNSLNPEGIPLGFEPLIFDYSLSHSWLCNYFSAASDAADELLLGIKPNQHGLIENYDDARRCVEVISRDVDAEPGMWLPWLIVDHTLRA